MSMLGDLIDSPVGPLLAAGDDKGSLHCLKYARERGIEPLKRRMEERYPDLDWQNGSLPELRKQLKEYFNKQRVSFDLPLVLDGTEFQVRVWEALCTIPYGSCWSYGDIARAVGSPKAVRAVGMANGRNPIPIIVPCHRVIGTDGKMVGFTGGMPIKLELLRLEGYFML